MSLIANKVMYMASGASLLDEAPSKTLFGAVPSAGCLALCLSELSQKMARKRSAGRMLVKACRNLFLRILFEAV